MVGLIVAPVLIGPALYYNLDWSPTADLWDNVSSAVLILGSAVIIEACRHARHAWQAGVGLLVGFALVFANGLNAFEHMSNKADHRADHRKSAMVDAENQSSARSEWSAKVDAAKAKVGDRLSSALEADVQRYTVENAQKWQATKECNPKFVTISAAFCAEHARLQGLADAARDRDEAAAKVRRIDDAARDNVTPTNADPFVAAVTSLVGIVGVAPTEEGKKGMRSLKSLSRTLALELLATFGPMLWLVLIDGLMTAAPAVARTVPGAAKQERAAKGEPKAAQPVASAEPADAPAKPASKRTPEFERFCADALEEGGTFTIAPTPAFKLWQDYCRARNLEPGTQKKFGGMMGERFTRDANNGYPRYLGVRARERKPTLTVVKSA
jgi:hypothetical protein